MSDPGARAANGPAPVRRGRSRHGCLCLFRVWEVASSAARSAACLLHRPRSIAIQILRNYPVAFVRKTLAANRSRSRALAWQFCPGNHGFKRAASRGRLAASRGLITLESRRSVGHHGGDAASVLGTVQGAALRSARACARPSGLDGACAQMIRGQLRDGRRMLLPSGTHSASMDPLDGIEESSRVFDPCRTRAISPLVEVHFSRF